MRAAVVTVALALAMAAPAVAQEPGSLLQSIEGPTQMRPLASGFDVDVGYQRLWAEAGRGPFFGDRDRWVAWSPPGRPTSSMLLDTQSMTVTDVPECRLSYGHRGLFAAVEVGETIALDGDDFRGTRRRKLRYRVVEPVGRYWPDG